MKDFIPFQEDLAVRTMQFEYTITRFKNPGHQVIAEPLEKVIIDASKSMDPLSALEDITTHIKNKSLEIVLKRQSYKKMPDKTKCIKVLHQNGF